MSRPEWEWVELPDELIIPRVTETTPEEQTEVDRAVGAYYGHTAGNPRLSQAELDAAAKWRRDKSRTEGKK